MIACLYGNDVQFATDARIFLDIPDGKIIDLGEDFQFPDGKVPVNDGGELVWKEEEPKKEYVDPVESLLDAIIAE